MSSSLVSQHGNRWHLKPSEGKGDGVFATEDIQPGTVLMVSPEDMVLQKPYSDEDVRAAFEHLDETEQQLYLDLSEGENAYETKLRRIFAANAFSNNMYACMHLWPAKINHSCSPNASVVRDSNAALPGSCVEVIAEKRIANGEEILISYNYHLETMTARQRRAQLLRSHGFRCLCSTCERSSAALWISDIRRRLISALVHTLSDCAIRNCVSAEDMSEHRPDAHDLLKVAQHRLESPLTPRERTTYSFLLAKLREAEGLTPELIASAYVEAASCLLQQILDMHSNIIILQSVTCVDSWMGMALDTISAVRSPERREPQWVEWRWYEMKDKPQLEMATRYVGTKIPFRGNS